MIKRHTIGEVRGIKFQIKDSVTIRIWKPTEIQMDEFKFKCDLIVKYLIDEGFFKGMRCKVEVIT